MRPIKFRVWDKLRKEMMDVYEISFDSEQVAGYISSEKKTRRLNPLDDDFELMQFTGLTDKNGKEIYEGDIVELKGKDKMSREVKTHSRIYVIEWSDTLTGFEPIKDDYIGPWSREWASDYEVIGNIYENPELLKGGEKE